MGLAFQKRCGLVVRALRWSSLLASPLATCTSYSWVACCSSGCSCLYSSNVTPLGTPIDAYAQHKYHECIGDDMTW
jgi:hypothetical protein